MSPVRNRHQPVWTPLLPQCAQPPQATYSIYTIAHVKEQLNERGTRFHLRMQSNISTDGCTLATCIVHFTTRHSQIALPFHCTSPLKALAPHYVKGTGSEFPNHPSVEGKLASFGKNPNLQLFISGVKY